MQTFYLLTERTTGQAALRDTRQGIDLYFNQEKVKQLSHAQSQIAGAKNEGTTKCISQCQSEEQGWN